MKDILNTPVFARWLDGLKDLDGKARILVRIKRLALGHSGDAKHIQNEIFELRIHYGPGYRVYYTERKSEIIILLAGGDKSSQKNDIQKALTLAKTIEV